MTLFFLTLFFSFFFNDTATTEIYTLSLHDALPISAGNDGPGLSTMGFPGSADLALSVGALYPGVFSRAPQPGVPPAPDVLAWFSSRGGDTDKPDVLAPEIGRA